MFYTRSEQTARVGYWCKRRDRFLTFPVPYPLIDLMVGTGLNSVSNSVSQTLINVVAQIFSGFISFGSLHIHTGGFEPWQWYDHV